jgi:hypothetical protein
MITVLPPFFACLSPNKPLRVLDVTLCCYDGRSRDGLHITRQAPRPCSIVFRLPFCTAARDSLSTEANLLFLFKAYGQYFKGILKKRNYFFHRSRAICFFAKQKGLFLGYTYYTN